MSLVVERLHQRLRSTRPLPRARIAEWNDAFAALDGDALTDGLASGEEWVLIRRLSLKMRWHAQAGGAAVALQCRDAMRAALAAALADPARADVVRYQTVRDALADLLYRGALGDRSRQWAWQRMGLVAHADDSPAETLAQGLARLQREPESTWPVLARLLRGEAATASLSAVLRAIPANTWFALFKSCPRTRGHALVLSAPARGAASTTIAIELPADPAWHELVAWGVARPALVERQCNTLTVLLASLWRDSAVAGPVECGAIVATVRRALLPSAAASAEPAAPRAAPLADTPDTALRAPAPRRDDLPALPALPDVVDRHATAWGGALFWVARLDPRALLDDGEDDAEAPALALRLRAIAEALGVPGDDPALRAFCGGDVPPQPVPDALHARAAAQVDAWSQWLATAAPDLPSPRIAAVCRRRGRLRFEPGWIELHLPLETVDVRVRRLGLDLDPGWLPWLGCVLRIRYDD